MPESLSVQHLALTVTDVDRSVPWYERVLGLIEYARYEDAKRGIREVALRSTEHDLAVLLVQHPDTVRTPGSPGDQTCTHAADLDGRRTGLDHVAFRVTSTAELHAWEERLAGYGVSYTPAKVARVDADSVVVVFHDPDGIQLEVWAGIAS